VEHKPTVGDLNDEIYILHREGRYTREDFERLWPQLVEAAGDDLEALETVWILSPKDWWEEKRRALEELSLQNALPPRERF